MPVGKEETEGKGMICAELLDYLMHLLLAMGDNGRMCHDPEGQEETTVDQADAHEENHCPKLEC